MIHIMDILEETYLKTYMTLTKMRNHMKFCFCIGKLSFSGAENVVRFLLESLAKRGHEVSVMLLERMPSEEEHIEGVRAVSAIVRGGGQFDLEDCIVKTDDMPYEQVTNYHDTYDNTLAQGMANAHKHFQDALTTGSEIRTPLESGIAALKVSLAALKSDKEKVVVTL
jgi:hypothetical protein